MSKYNIETLKKHCNKNSIIINDCCYENINRTTIIYGKCANLYCSNDF